MAKTAKDYGQIASNIIKFVGGKDNIAHAGHCMTRLRITPKDTSLVDLDELKKIGVTDIGYRDWFIECYVDEDMDDKILVDAAEKVGLKIKRVD